MRILEMDGAVPLRQAQLALPAGSFNEGMPTRTLLQFLASTIPSLGLQSSRTMLAISDAGVAVRDFRLPRIPGKELRSAVTYEGRRLVPMDPQDVYYAWHAQRDHAGYAIYLVAARREMVEALLGALAASGLPVERLDLKALALARGARVSDGLILDWGQSEATLVLVATGRPRFFRSFPLDSPGDDLTSQFEEMSASIAALLKFVRTTGNETPVSDQTPLYLAGRFFVIPGAAQAAAERFRYQVRPPTPSLPQGLPADFPWPTHLATLGLLQTSTFMPRITPAVGGDNRVAA
jgi:Tfp pilus assembly PilM family ATPase